MPPGKRTRTTSPRFYAFLCAQFLGALNDNAFKVTLIMVVLATVADETAQMRYSSAATVLFPLPFLLFSPFAGYLADRFAKHRVLVAAKAPEIAAMVLATLGFQWQSLPFLLVVLFLMATQSAFFSPPKYGILPEVFDDGDLPLANGVLQLATNLAILTGSVAGVYIYSLSKGHLVYAGIAYTGVAVVGTLITCFVPVAPAGNPAARPAWNVFASVREDYTEVRRVPGLLYIIGGLAYFGFLGAFFLTVVPVFGHNVLNLSEEAAGALLAILSIGIGVGSVLAGRLSRGQVELGLVPLGSLGLSAFALDLALFAHAGGTAIFGVPVRAVFDLLGLGLAGGFFSVPLNALLQQRSPKGMKGRLVAFSNVLTFSGVLLAGALLGVLTGPGHLSTGTVIVFVAILTVVGTVYVISLLPDFLVRLVLWMLTNTIYRVRSVGAENLPRDSGFLIVVNHVSWVDFLLVGAACDRVIRFLMYRPYYEWSGLNWFFRRMHVIPVAGGDPAEKKNESLDIARREIEAGNAVCIFAEGAITRTGNLLRFRRGLEQIAVGVGCPIVPVWLDGVWGSIFSFERGRFFFKRPRRLFAPVTVHFGEALPATASAFAVRERIQELSAQAFDRRQRERRPLAVEFIRSACRHWRRPFLVEPKRRLSYGSALLDALALRDTVFAAGDENEERVGIFLPPGVDAVLATLAVFLAGKVPVHLDATAPGKIADRMISGAGLRRVLTGRRFVEMSGCTDGLSGAELVFVDGVDGAYRGISPIHRLLFALTPSRLLARWVVWGDRQDATRLATVLYSYPRDEPETPVGAMLTHHNLLANIDSLRQVLRVRRRDAILSLIPFSNALGFSTGFCLPALTGARVVFGASLLKSEALGAFCRREGVSLLPATPALLEGFVRGVGDTRLPRLRFVAVGGGRLEEAARAAFAERFAVTPYEGYGCPECAPMISLNVPDFGAGRQAQKGTRQGSIGHPLPGICVRIVDPGSGVVQPPGKVGLLLVRGPNVMAGYLGEPERTRAVLKDGWFVTGEYGWIDRDGFLVLLGAGDTVTDSSSREQGTTAPNISPVK